MSNNTASMSDFAAAGPTSNRAWSDQQRAIFSWFKNTMRQRSHLIVRARAGSGKTSTVLEAISHAPESRILLCAFNKSIATELQERMTNPNATAATLHSLGFGCIRRFKERVNVTTDGSRARYLSDKVCGSLTPDQVKRIVSRLHTFGREMAPHAIKPEELRDIAIQFDCVPDDDWCEDGFDIDFVCDKAVKAMALGAEDISTGIDFTDMLYLPVRNSWIRPKFDLVCIDEGQDMNRTQLEIAQKLLMRDGRMCLVGDDRQAIYGFRGADSGSLDRMKQELGAKELGLNVTYRCGSTIVAAAQSIVADILAKPDAHEGQILSTSLDKLTLPIDKGGCAPGDFVLSRVNAPLVKVALSLIRDGRRARIQGRDIGAGLRAIIKKVASGRAAGSLPEFLKRLALWELKEARRAEDADLQSKADMVHDQAETLRALADGCAAVREIDARIETLFADAGPGTSVVCSSIHRAKGLEADTVFVLRDTLYPRVVCECGHRHSYGKAECAKCQCADYRANETRQREEANLAYVAITRARRTLTWVVGR